MEEKIDIYCLGSGSDGNCYAFKKRNEVVLVECGLDYQVILNKLLTYGILPLQIKAVICTHGHKDHTKALLDFAKRDVPYYICESVCQGGGVKDKAKIQLTSWLAAYCFKVEHDVEAYGFAFLDKETKESILFINDTFEFEFPRELRSIPFDSIFIECNYLQTQLNAIRRSANLKFKYDRQERTHLSLLGTKHMLDQMNLSKTKVIVLMHLSMDCANEAAMKTEISTVYKIRTLVAHRDGGIN